MQHLWKGCFAGWQAFKKRSGTEPINPPIIQTVPVTEENQARHDRDSCDVFVSACRSSYNQHFPTHALHINKNLISTTNSYAFCSLVPLQPSHWHHYICHAYTRHYFSFKTAKLYDMCYVTFHLCHLLPWSLKRNRSDMAVIPTVNMTALHKVMTCFRSLFPILSSPSAFHHKKKSFHLPSVRLVAQVVWENLVECDDYSRCEYDVVAQVHQQVGPSSSDHSSSSLCSPGRMDPLKRNIILLE